jgi:hypothetical protein
VRRPDPAEIQTPERFYVVAFDYETYEKEETERGKRILEPYLVCAVVFCQECFFEVPWRDPCPNCGPKRRRWYERNEEFCKWLFFDRSRDQKAPVIALAHNARRFDSFFPLEYLLKSGKIPILRLNGQQCLSLKAARTTIKDFLAFAPMKLADVPGAFGFSTSKGYFPWRLASENNLDGWWPTHPAKGYYAPDLMKTEKERREFDDWYEENRWKPFDFRREAVKYCRLDADILARGIQEYARMALKIGGVNPITSPSIITLAGLAAAMYRARFMPDENSIGIMPRGGYQPGKTQSAFACRTLDWMNEKRAAAGLPLIRHRNRGGEKEIPRPGGGGPSFFLDGYVPETKEAFEVQ